ncbi:hypothetical protein HYV86_03945 [Candidatus Woesearchaeota archaeon]|nr:hypothetical protein [Candidatus Woesearchaeota archaeon]
MDYLPPARRGPHFEAAHNRWIAQAQASGNPETMYDFAGFMERPAPLQVGRPKMGADYQADLDGRVAAASEPVAPTQTDKEYLPPLPAEINLNIDFFRFPNFNSVLYPSFSYFRPQKSKLPRISDLLLPKILEDYSYDISSKDFQKYIVPADTPA